MFNSVSTGFTRSVRSHGHDEPRSNCPLCMHRGKGGQCDFRTVNAHITILSSNVEERSLFRSQQGNRERLGIELIRFGSLRLRSLLKLADCRFLWNVPINLGTVPSTLFERILFKLEPVVGRDTLYNARDRHLKHHSELTIGTSRARNECKKTAGFNSCGFCIWQTPSPSLTKLQKIARFSSPFPNRNGDRCIDEVG